jgi:hypothetical protein
MTFPRAHWAQIYSTNPLVAEIKRRTNVVGIFPNDAAMTRLVGAMMLEQNDEWSLNRRYKQLEGLQTVSDTATTRMSAVPRCACESQPVRVDGLHHSAGHHQTGRLNTFTSVTSELVASSDLDRKRGCPSWLLSADELSRAPEVRQVALGQRVHRRGHRQVGGGHPQSRQHCFVGDGQNCIAAVVVAGCFHVPHVVCRKKLRDLPEFK